MHFDSSSFAFQDSEDVALNGSKKKGQDLSNPTRPVHLHLHFCQKYTLYTLLTHTSHHTKVKKIENTFLITFHIPLLSIGIMCKLHHCMWIMPTSKRLL